MECKGRNLEDHCCWLKGKVCSYLEENTQPGFRWTCGLRRELGDWDAVLADPRYIENVKPVLDGVYGANGRLGSTCRDWPEVQCNLCGQGLDGNDNSTPE